VWAKWNTAVLGRACNGGDGESKVVNLEPQEVAIIEYRPAEGGEFTPRTVAGQAVGVAEGDAEDEATWQWFRGSSWCSLILVTEEIEREIVPGWIQYDCGPKGCSKGHALTRIYRWSTGEDPRSQHPFDHHLTTAAEGVVHRSCSAAGRHGCGRAIEHGWWDKGDFLHQAVQGIRWVQLRRVNEVGWACR